MLRSFFSSIRAVTVIGFILMGCGGDDVGSASEDTYTQPTNTNNTVPTASDGTSTATSTGLTNKTPAVCGDGVKARTEECDREDFGGETCARLVPGAYGQLNCESDCTINESMCVSENSDSGYGSGIDTADDI